MSGLGKKLDSFKVYDFYGWNLANRLMISHFFVVPTNALKHLFGFQIICMFGHLNVRYIPKIDAKIKDSCGLNPQFFQLVW